MDVVRSRVEPLGDLVVPVTLGGQELGRLLGD
jgi:hypothetical protein